MHANAVEAELKRRTYTAFFKFVKQFLIEKPAVRENCGNRDPAFIQRIDQFKEILAYQRLSARKRNFENTAFRYLIGYAN